MKLIVLLCLTIISVNATLSPAKSSKKQIKTKEKDWKVKIGPQSDSVFTRNLIEEEPLAKDIIIENGAYYKDTNNRLFNGTVLGYVTPVSRFLIRVRFMRFSYLFFSFRFFYSGTITDMTFQRCGDQSLILSHQYGYKCYARVN